MGVHIVDNDLRLRALLQIFDSLSFFFEVEVIVMTWLSSAMFFTVQSQKSLIGDFPEINSYCKYPGYLNESKIRIRCLNLVSINLS